MLLAIFQEERVYEGNEYFLNAIYPMPSLSKIVVGNANISEAGIVDGIVSAQSPIFREDLFDPTTRIRRGRIYTAGSPNRRDWLSDRVNHFPYGPPVFGGPPNYQFDTYRSFNPSHPVNTAKRPTIFLGDANYRTAWHIIGAERIFNGETLFTLKATDTLGTLPDLIESKLPSEHRAEILDGIEKVADAAHKYLPVPIVDVCREFARILLAAWLPTTGVEPKGDLDKLYRLVPEANVGVRSAAQIINRLHPRGKSSERERQAKKGNEIRAIAAGDGDLAISLVAFLLREVGWAS